MKYHQKGMVYMHNPDEPRHRADLTLRMDLKTFNEICEGSIGGIKGVLTGRIRF
jgi:putative sterol carrier protein